MVYEVRLDCFNCGHKVQWLYYEDEGIYPEPSQGCPGKNCARIYQICISELDDERLTRVKEEIDSRT